MTTTETDEIRESFAKILRMKRHALGLSQEELGHKAGLAMRFISLLECNKRQPTISTLYSLSHALGIPLSEMMIEIEDEIQNKSRPSVRAT